MHNIRTVRVICHLFVSGILKTMVSHDQQNHAVDVEMQCDMLFILSTLCEGEQHRKVCTESDTGS